LLPRAADELKTLFVASGGMAEDLIHDIPTVQERVDRIMADHHPAAGAVSGGGLRERFRPQLGTC
jgi:hypothetical protein